jgi:hypothetical protein
MLLDGNFIVFVCYSSVNEASNVLHFFSLFNNNCLFSPSRFLAISIAQNWILGTVKWKSNIINCIMPKCALLYYSLKNKQLFTCQGESRLEQVHKYCTITVMATNLMLCFHQKFLLLNQACKYTKKIPISFYTLVAQSVQYVTKSKANLSNVPKLYSSTCPLKLSQNGLHL